MPNTYLYLSLTDGSAKRSARGGVFGKPTSSAKRTACKKSADIFKVSPPCKIDLEFADMTHGEIVLARFAEKERRIQLAADNPVQ